MADIYRLVDGGFLAILSQTEDPRDRRGLVYSIESLLTIAICTYLCNGNTFEEMEVFAETHRERRAARKAAKAAAKASAPA